MVSSLWGSNKKNLWKDKELVAKKNIQQSLLLSMTCMDLLIKRYVKCSEPWLFVFCSFSFFTRISSRLQQFVGNGFGLFASTVLPNVHQVSSESSAHQHVLPQFLVYFFWSRDDSLMFIGLFLTWCFSCAAHESGARLLVNQNVMRKCKREVNENHLLKDRGKNGLYCCI